MFIGLFVLHYVGRVRLELEETFSSTSVHAKPTLIPSRDAFSVKQATL